MSCRALPLFSGVASLGPASGWQCPLTTLRVEGESADLFAHDALDDLRQVVVEPVLQDRPQQLAGEVFKGLVGVAHGQALNVWLAVAAGNEFAHRRERGSGGAIGKQPVDERALLLPGRRCSLYRLGLRLETQRLRHAPRRL